MPEFDPALLDWLLQQYQEGAILTAACSGTWLLAAAGLLDGLNATTHWAYAHAFTDHFPKVQLDARRALVLSGKDNKIVTAGGGSLWTELVLYLISRLVGQEAAVQTSKLYLVDWARDLFCSDARGSGRAMKARLASEPGTGRHFVLHPISSAAHTLLPEAGSASRALSQ